MHDKKHVFLSYSTKDIDYANQVEAELKHNDYIVWRDKSRLRGGDEWRNMIQEALEDSWAVVVIQSPDSQKSEWVANEILYAQDLGIPVIPILLRGNKWFGFLNKQYVDMRNNETAPLPDAFYATMLRYAPPAVLDKDVQEVLQTNTSERVALIPRLEKIARNERSPKGYAAREALEKLQRDSDDYVRSMAGVALGKLNLIQADVLEPAPDFAQVIDQAQLEKTIVPDSKPVPTATRSKSGIPTSTWVVLAVAAIIIAGLVFLLLQDRDDDPREANVTDTAIPTVETTAESTEVATASVLPTESATDVVVDITDEPTEIVIEVTDEPTEQATETVQLTEQATEKTTESVESIEPFFSPGINGSILREGPGTQYDTIANVSYSIPLTVIAKLPDGSYYEVLYGNTSAWVYYDTGTLQGSTASIPIKSVFAIFKPGPGGSTLREGPGTNYPTIGNSKYIENFLVTGQSEDEKYYQVLYGDGKVAWLFNPLGTTVGDLESIPVVEAPPLP